MKNSRQYIQKSRELEKKATRLLSNSKRERINRDNASSSLSSLSSRAAPFLFKKEKLSNSQRKRNMWFNKRDFEELDIRGFFIEKLNGIIHVRISNVDYDTKVDVWPTVNKILPFGSYKKAEVYKSGDLVRIVQRIFDKEDEGKFYV